MKVKYIIKYKKGQKPKRVTGYVRIPNDLPEGFTSQQFIEWACERHNLTPEMGLELTLKNYTSKNFKYGNESFRKVQKTAAKKAAGNRS